MSFGRESIPLRVKLWQLNWPLVLLLAVIASIGFGMLYSAANGSPDPWMKRQVMRFGAGVAAMLVVALVDIRFWMRGAYVLYGIGLALLVAVEFYGHVGMGAQRWIDLGILQLQPSEIMKMALILALARYFHPATLQEVRRPLFLLTPLVIVALPVALVLKQPDLGTAGLLLMGAAAIFYLAGVPLRWFAGVGGLALASIPVAWNFLHDYQKKRVLTFLNPEQDPMGAGYHILQSKIALGSGGMFGKGLLQGSQSHLNFLPEKQTDFIFTMLAEEFGMVGGLALLLLYLAVIVYGYAISLRCGNQFGRLVGLGVTTTFFLYVFINIAMVMGLLPVVGVPLPLISYGGTSMLTLLFGFGLILCVSIHRDVPIGRRFDEED